MSNTNTLKNTPKLVPTDYKIMAIKALPAKKVLTLEDTRKIIEILNYDLKESNQFPQSFYELKK